MPPRYSVAVPTRQRIDTLAACLRTLEDVPYQDVEFLIQHNGPSAECERLVASLRDPRFRYACSDDDVPLHVNWERALARLRGEWLFFLGDDDGVLPEIFETLDRVGALDRSAEAIWWRPAAYFWPEHCLPSYGGNVHGYCGVGEVRVVDARRMLTDVLSFRRGYYELPMLYTNVVVRRTLVERVKARRNGVYFHPAPDVASGIFNATEIASYLAFDHPLSIAGASRHSIGMGMHLQKDPERIAAARKAYGTPACSDPADLLFGTRSLECAAAGVFRDVQSELRDTSLPPFDVGRFLSKAINQADGVPALYDLACLDIRTVADRAGFDLSRVEFPPRRELPEWLLHQGTIRYKNGAEFFSLDSLAAGARDVHTACRLIAPRIPPFRIRRLLRPIELGASSTPRGGAPRFRADAAAFDFLGFGWHPPEAWGVWASQAIAYLDLPVPAGGDDPLEIVLDMMLPEGSRGPVDIALGDGHARRFWPLWPRSVVACLPLPRCEVRSSSVSVRLECPLKRASPGEARNRGIALLRVVIQDKTYSPTGMLRRSRQLARGRRLLDWTAERVRAALPGWGAPSPG